MTPWLFLWGASGATIVLSTGKIAEPLREVGPKMLSCPMCTGFWVGLAAGAWVFRKEDPVDRAVGAVAFGFGVSLLSYAVNTGLTFLEQQTDAARQQSEAFRLGMAQVEQPQQLPP
jgi:hypothetical protein